MLHIPNLDRTKAALAAYEAEYPALADAFWAAEDKEQQDAAIAAMNAAEDKVREALWLDTQDRNSRQTIMGHMSVKGVEELVASIVSLEKKHAS